MLYTVNLYHISSRVTTSRHSQIIQPFFTLHTSNVFFFWIFQNYNLTEKSYDICLVSYPLNSKGTMLFHENSSSFKSTLQIKNLVIPKFRQNINTSYLDFQVSPVSKVFDISTRNTAATTIAVVTAPLFSFAILIISSIALTIVPFLYIDFHAYNFIIIWRKSQYKYRFFMQYAKSLQTYVHV